MSGKAQPESVYCAPYWEIRELKGRYDPDPYHPAPVGVGGRRRILRRVVRATAGAALAAVVVLGGAMMLRPSGLLPGFAPPVFHHHAQR